MFKVSNRNTRIRCEICSKLKIKTYLYFPYNNSIACSELTIETLEQGVKYFQNMLVCFHNYNHRHMKFAQEFIETVHHWHRSGVSIVNFEHISHLFLVFLLLTLSMQLPARNTLSQ